MKRRYILGLLGAFAFVFAGRLYFTPPTVDNPAGLSPSELSKVRWKLNAPLLFRELSRDALWRFPSDLWQWRSKNRELLRIESLPNGPGIWVFTGKTKRGGVSYMMHRTQKGWEIGGTGNWYE